MDRKQLMDEALQRFCGDGGTMDGLSRVVDLCEREFAPSKEAKALLEYLAATKPWWDDPHGSSSLTGLVEAYRKSLAPPPRYVTELPSETASNYFDNNEERRLTVAEVLARLNGEAAGA